MANKTTKDGLPRSSFAYAPSADPATWKLPYLTASGSPDPNHLPGAIAALSSGGFRGQKVDVPASAIKMIKTKLRAAHKKLNPDVDAPNTLSESFEEGVQLLRRAGESGKVVVCPSCGDQLVVPEYSGQFGDLPEFATSSPVEVAPSPDIEEAPMSDPITDSNAALDIIERIIALKAAEANEGDAGDVTILNDALVTMTKFLLGEADELKANTPEAAAAVGNLCSACGHSDSCDCGLCTCDVPFHDTGMAESGRRHNSHDAALLAQISDLVKKLGVKTDSEEKTKEPESIAPLAESLEFLSDKPEMVTFTESGDGSEYASLREAEAIFDDDKHEIIITPIRPGWGNPRDNYYYPAATLKEAVLSGVFNKRPIKMYANHPPRDEQKKSSDRNVWDWVSSMKETWWDEEKQKPQSRIKVYDDRFWERAKKAPDEIAFSIIGGGQSRHGRVESREGKIVESLKHIGSVDWVTEAGAGGAIERFAESAHEEFDMELDKLTAEQLLEARPDLVAAILAAQSATPASTPEAVAESSADASSNSADAKTAEAKPTDDKTADATKPAEAKTEEAKTTAGEGTGNQDSATRGPSSTATPEPAAAQAPAVANEQPPVIEDKPAQDRLAEALAENDELKRLLAEQKLKDAIAANRTATAQLVSAIVSESTLPEAAKEVITSRFAEATYGETFMYTDEVALKGAVAKELADFEKVLSSVGRKPLVRGLGAAPVDGAETSVRDAVAKRLSDKWGTTDVPVPAATETATDVAQSVITESGSSQDSSGVAKRLADKFFN